MKHLRHIVSIGIAIGITWLLLHAPPLMPDVQPTESVSVLLPQQALLRQSPYACGPYSAAAALNAVGIATNPVDLTSNMWFFFKGRGTLPWGMHLAIWNADAQTKSLWLGWLTEEERLRVLYKRIHDGHPVIALVNMHNYPHYIVLLGYNPLSSTFDIYDPLHEGSNGGYTVDSNGVATGNRRISADTLFAAWEQGGIYGLYRWYGIAVH